MIHLFRLRLPTDISCILAFSISHSFCIIKDPFPRDSSCFFVVGFTYSIADDSYVFCVHAHDTMLLLFSAAILLLCSCYDTIISVLLITVNLDEAFRFLGAIVQWMDLIIGYRRLGLHCIWPVIDAL